MINRKLLEQGMKFLGDTNREQLETLLRDPRFQRDFADEFNRTKE